MATRVPMASIDAAWLGMEDPTNLMIVTGVMALDGKLDIKRLRRILDRRLKPFGRFHQRVVRPRARGNLPHWQDDVNFDINNHLTHVGLPAPGGDDELREIVSELMSMPLDFSRPLWHMHVIDNYLGGSVLLARVHHCIADGVALVRVMLSLTDESPDAKPHPASTRPSVQASRPRLERLRSAVGRGAARGQELVTHPHQALDLARVGAYSAYRLGRMVVLPPDPGTVFKGKLGRPKRAAWSEPVPLDDFKEIGNAFGATVNDVLVAVATGALRRYMERRGQPTYGIAIRASVPVNLRPLDQAHKLGNAFGLVFLTLPIGIVDPVRRVLAIKKEMDELKRSPDAVVSFGLINLIGLAPMEVEQLGLRFFGSKATAVLTNVPGPRQSLYMAGRKIDKVMFWVPQSGHLGLGISILSYDGGVMLGIATDAGLVPDPERIVENFKIELESMGAAAKRVSQPKKVRVAARKRRAPKKPVDRVDV
jgi:diacylglycerol O-acyltransferase / wax synthase